jgi:hypothetical protein
VPEAFDTLICAVIERRALLPILEPLALVFLPGHQDSVVEAFEEPFSSRRPCELAHPHSHTPVRSFNRRDGLTRDRTMTAATGPSKGKAERAGPRKIASENTGRVEVGPR